MNKVMMIEWQPYLLEGFNWWVYEYYIDDNQELPVIDVPTSRLVGRYKELDQAQNAHPQAHFSDNAQKAIDEGLAIDTASMAVLA